MSKIIIITTDMRIMPSRTFFEFSKEGFAIHFPFFEFQLCDCFQVAFWNPTSLYPLILASFKVVPCLVRALQLSHLSLF